MELEAQLAQESVELEAGKLEQVQAGKLPKTKELSQQLSNNNEYTAAGYIKHSGFCFTSILHISTKMSGSPP